MNDISAPISNTMRAALPPEASGRYAVVRSRYNGAADVWTHRTLKAAFRRCTSVIREMVKEGVPDRNIDVAGIVTPAGDVLSWTEARNLIEDGAR
jgi:hypothetical protein